MTAGGSSTPEVQRLLAVLAAGRRAAELGTAFGDGALAIASTATSLVTVEIDEERAARARERLSGFANVELHVGDWREVLPARGPFDLVFLDSGDARSDRRRGARRGGRPGRQGRPRARTGCARPGARVLDDAPGVRRGRGPHDMHHGGSRGGADSRVTLSTMRRR